MKANYSAQGNRHTKYKKAQEAHQTETLKTALQSLMVENKKKRKAKQATILSDNDNEMNNLEEFLNNNSLLDSESENRQFGQKSSNLNESEVKPSKELSKCKNIDAAMDHYINEHFLLSDTIRRPLKKKTKIDKSSHDFSPILFLYVNDRPGKANYRVVKALLDSGASATMMSKSIAKKLKVKTTTTSTQWPTAAGAMKTNQKCEIDFVMP